MTRIKKPCVKVNTGPGKYHDGRINLFLNFFIPDWSPTFSRSAFGLSLYRLWLALYVNILSIAVHQISQLLTNGLDFVSIGRKLLGTLETTIIRHETHVSTITNTDNKKAVLPDCWPVWILDGLSSVYFFLFESALWYLDIFLNIDKRVLTQ